MVRNIEENSLQTSRLSSKGQTTIPSIVRKHLSLEAGDDIAFEIADDNVIIRKAMPIDVEYAKSLGATLATEWESKEDSEAYDNL